MKGEKWVGTEDNHFRDGFLINKGKDKRGGFPCQKSFVLKTCKNRILPVKRSWKLTFSISPFPVLGEGNQEIMVQVGVRNSAFYFPPELITADSEGGN